jgi:hypothetical protein
VGRSFIRLSDANPLPPTHSTGHPGIARSTSLITRIVSQFTDSSGQGASVARVDICKIRIASSFPAQVARSLSNLAFGECQGENLFEPRDLLGK